MTKGKWCESFLKIQRDSSLLIWLSLLDVVINSRISWLSCTPCCVSDARASFIFLRNAAAVCAGQRKLYDCGLDFTAAAAIVKEDRHPTRLQSVDICRVTVFFEVYNCALMSILLSVVTVVITDKIEYRVVKYETKIRCYNRRPEIRYSFNILSSSLNRLGAIQIAQFVTYTHTHTHNAP